MIELIELEHYSFLVQINDNNYEGEFSVEIIDNDVEINIIGIRLEGEDIDITNKISPSDLFQLEEDIAEYGDRVQWKQDNRRLRAFIS